MEEPNVKNGFDDTVATNDSSFQEQFISSNWRVTQDNKRLCDAITTIARSKAPASLSLADIVQDYSCVILQPPNANLENEREVCQIEINLTDGRKISRIGIVSEGSVLEYFKESGEYADTAFAELIDEFEDTTVYYAELFFKRPTPQATIKFTRIHNSRSNMYLYGIKLVLEREEKSPSNEKRMYESAIQNLYNENIAPGKNGPIPNFTNIFDYEGNFPSEMDACLNSIIGNIWKPRGEKTCKKKDPSTEVIKDKNEKPIPNKDEIRPSIELYMDKKFREMENRLMQRIDEVEAKTMKKLDTIMKHLESRS